MTLKGHSIYTFLLIIVAQVVFSALLGLGPYVMLSLLPVSILILPTRYSTVRLMLNAFIVGLVVDILADGILGLNALALVPVAYIRRGLLTLVCGEELFSRGDEVYYNKQGAAKISVLILVSQAIFLLIYLLVDSAGTRSAEFIGLRFVGSMLASYILSMFIFATLTTDRE